MNQSTNSLFMRRLMLAISIVTLLVAIFAPSGLALAQQNTASVTAGTINLRSGPGPGYESLGTLAYGDVVTLLGRTGDSTWVNVETSAGLQGWITTKFIVASDPVSGLPVLGESKPWGVVKVSVLNIRSGPALTFDIVATAHRGDYLTLLGRSLVSARFVKVLYNGDEGWTNVLMLHTSVPAINLPILTDVPTPESQPGGETNVAPTITPPAEEVTVASIGVVSASTLNLRKGPGPGYESVGQLVLGDTVTLLGRTSNKAWLKVLTAGGVEGWATQRYIKANGLITPLPVLADADAWASVSAGTLNVRQGPGTEFEVILTLTKGTLVTVLGRTADRLWAKILVEGIEGWANTGRLKINIPLSFLPVVE